MWMRFADTLRCPCCRGALALDAFERTTVELPNDAIELARRNGVYDERFDQWIESGVLLCKPCSAMYPIIDGLPTTHPLFSEELFVPITVVGDVMTLDEAIDLANKTEYGLTAGIFSEDDREIEQFFDRVQAGVTYANRRAGATTGAWPGINSFGGWKASGSTGRGTGGPYYVQQFMREQSRVRIR